MGQVIPFKPAKVHRQQMLNIASAAFLPSPLWFGMWLGIGWPMVLGLELWFKAFQAFTPAPEPAEVVPLATARIRRVRK